ncbi:MAG: endonuclease/exonuclease/phosphatase family protein [Deltaproteobacteria bacterium]|nr:endonuclease/exonuclease/phosphatase family protein [Deltaproteobacteria bacterium]
MQLSVLSYNIHKGFSTSSRRFTLKAIKEGIQASGADLVFLQEVLGRHDLHARRHAEWPTESQFEYLADTVWGHYAYGKNAVYDEGHHGNALLSKLPIVAWENFDVSTNRFERRGVLHAVVNDPESGINIHTICLHFNLLRQSRSRQLSDLCNIVAQHVPKASPLIIAGDFNDWNSRASNVICKELSLREAFKELHGRYAKTFPSRLPVAQLDRIYFRGFTPVRAKVLVGREWSRLSDHSPILSVLEL